MSDDLIKRDDAIDAIECITWYHQNRNKDMVSGANSDEHQAWYKEEDVYNALENVPSADRPQGWIPCDEMMPEYRKTVLISTFWGVKTGFLDNTEAYGGFWEIIEDDGIAALHNVYAWMPLPEPWKVAEDE